MPSKKKLHSKHKQGNAQAKDVADVRSTEQAAASDEHVKPAGATKPAAIAPELAGLDHEADAAPMALDLGGGGGGRSKPVLASGLVPAPTGPAPVAPSASSSSAAPHSQAQAEEVNGEREDEEEQSEERQTDATSADDEEECCTKRDMEAPAANVGSAAAKQPNTTTGTAAPQQAEQQAEQKHAKQAKDAKQAKTTADKSGRKPESLLRRLWGKLHL